MSKGAEKYNLPEKLVELENLIRLGKRDTAKQLLREIEEYVPEFLKSLPPSFVDYYLLKINKYKGLVELGEDKAYTVATNVFSYLSKMERIAEELAKRYPQDKDIAIINEYIKNAMEVYKLLGKESQPKQES